MNTLPQKFLITQNFLTYQSTEELPVLNLILSRRFTITQI